MRKLSFMQNTIILVISNLVTGSLTFLFSIILSREIGAQGVGLYQMVMPMYVLFICITCGGVTTAISKVISEKNSQNNVKELNKSITASIAFFSFWTILMSIIVVLLAPFLSSSILRDTRTFVPILVFVPALVFVAIGSILKGYFYGLQNTTFPAIIDIVEKGIRIIVLVALVTYLKDYGLKYQIAGAVAAMTAGELSSTVLLYIFYKRSRSNAANVPGKPDNIFQIIVNVLTISLPLCLNGLLSTVMGTAIAAIAPRRLQDAGFAIESSLALFGKVGGMALNIVMYPAIIIGAISIILVPVISEASAGKSMPMINRRIHSALKVTAVIAAASAGLLFALPDELGKLFYSRNDLGNIIFSLSFGVIFIYMEGTLFGILNGLGKQKILLRNTLIMSLIDIVLLYILLGIPEINIYGYAINFVVSPLVGCILNYIEIRKATGIEISFNKVILFPVVIALVEVISINNTKLIVRNLIASQSTASVIMLMIGIGTYCAFYFLLRSFTGGKTQTRHS